MCTFSQMKAFSIKNRAKVLLFFYIRKKSAFFFIFFLFYLRAWRFFCNFVADFDELCKILK